MALLSVIRRWHFREGMPIREIKRRTGLSRNTIRKYLRAGVVDPKFKVPDRPSKLDPFAEKLSGWLRVEAGRSRKQRRTVKQMHADLVALGYDGSYGRVAAYERAWTAERQRDSQISGRGTFVPLVFAPGEAFQFDWSEDWAMLGGEHTKLQVAHTKLSHSRAFIVRAYLIQTHEMLFDALTQAFRVLGGVPRRGIFDNMKTAVDRIGLGKARQVNARFAAMASHYLFEPEFCNPASGWEKGQVENQVGNLRDQLFRPKPRVKSLVELNAWLEDQCIAYAKRTKHPEFKDRTIWEVFQDERASLMELRGPFDGFVEKAVRASTTCLIMADHNRYSVDARAAGRMVLVRSHAERIVVLLGDEVVADHPRHFRRDQIIYDPWHYLPVLVRKPGALRNGAPFKDWDLPPALAQVRAKLKSHADGDRQFVKVLGAVLDHGLAAVEAACAEALQAGIASGDVILTVLARQRQPAPPPSITTPDALRLKIEPAADCGRYDSIRKVA